MDGGAPAPARQIPCDAQAIGLLSSFMTDIRATLLARLAAAVGTTQVLTDPADLAPYLTDWRGRYHGRALAVVPR